MAAEPLTGAKAYTGKASRQRDYSSSHRDERAKDHHAQTTVSTRKDHDDIPPHASWPHEPCQCLRSYPMLVDPVSQRHHAELGPKRHSTGVIMVIYRSHAICPAHACGLLSKGMSRLLWAWTSLILPPRFLTNCSRKWHTFLLLGY